MVLSAASQPHYSMNIVHCACKCMHCSQLVEGSRETKKKTTTTTGNQKGFQSIITVMNEKWFLMLIYRSVCIERKKKKMHKISRWPSLAFSLIQHPRFPHTHKLHLLCESVFYAKSISTKRLKSNGMGNGRSFIVCHFS